MAPENAPTTRAAVLATNVHTTLASKMRRAARIVDMSPPHADQASRRSETSRLSATRARRSGECLRDLHPLRRDRTGDCQRGVLDVTTLRDHQAELDRVA